MPTALERLRRRAQYLAVAAARRKAVTPGLILQARPRASTSDAARVGITASRKVGNAVGRNRAKRRLRALADEVLGVRAAAGHDYVLIARRATLERDFAGLRKDLEKALKGLDLYRAPAEARDGSQKEVTA